MYKQRKNFSFLDFPTIAERKNEVLASKTSLLRENLNIDSLNALYQNKEIDKNKLQQQPSDVSTTPSTDLKFNTLEAPKTTEAELKKTYDGSLLLGISKPYRITFTDLQPQNNALPNIPEKVVSEEVEVLDDEVLAPLDSKEKETKIEDDKVKEVEEPEKKDKDSKLDYDFLVILPQSEILPKELIAAINKAGQGVIGNPIIQAMTEPPIPFGKNNIKSIEDDIEGYSVAGIDNPIALNLMKSNKK
jgi:hypothetical protein